MLFVDTESSTKDLWDKSTGGSSGQTILLQTATDDTRWRLQVTTTHTTTTHASSTTNVTTTTTATTTTRLVVALGKW